MGAMGLRTLAACAAYTTTSGNIRPEKPPESHITRSAGGTSTYSPATELTPPNTSGFGMSRGIAAPFAISTRMRSCVQKLGEKITHLRLITATIAGAFADYCATPATSSYTTGKQFPHLSGQYSTSKIISITPDGVEDVFDIQVDGTENFIANGIVSHNTRWAPQDLIGRVVGDMAKNEGADQYEVFEFPAILDTTDPDTGEPAQKALWPEFFDIPALLRTKASMPTYQWNAQYQQQPTSEEAAVVKREWWQQWERDQPPPCDYIIMSLDAAAETNNRADYTSLTVWGVFLNEDTDCHNLILLHAIKDRFEFPELKRMALEQYARWEPDGFIVEKKSAGVALYQELRRTGLPVQEYTPHRGSGDKMARLNSVADIIASGIVWVPDRRWAEEVVEEIAAFPFGPNDDHVDSTVMALLRFRQGGFIALPTDEIDEPEYSLPPREGYY
jgi:predicted phage terminase large subunit-like protein